MACASILGIEDASFTELAEGGSLSDAVAAVQADAGDDAKPGPVDGGVDGPTSCTPCTTPGGERCAGTCLGTRCGNCPCGMTNIAALGQVQISGGGEGYLVTDGNPDTVWSADSPEPNQEAFVRFSAPRLIGRVAIYGPRALPSGASPATHVILSVGPSATTLTPDENGDAVWNRAPTFATEVRLGILATARNAAPAVAELEICGQP